MRRVLLALLLCRCVDGVSRPTTIVHVDGHDDRPWACRFALRVVDRDVEPSAPEPHHHASERVYVGGPHTIARSGARTYEIWSVPSEVDPGPHRWEIRRDGAAPLIIGDDALVGNGPDVSSDGRGAILLEWAERGAASEERLRRIIVDGDRLVPITLPGASWSDAALAGAGPSGWMVVARSLRTGLGVFRVHGDGTLESVLSVPAAHAAGALAVEADGTLAAVIDVDDGLLAFVSTALGTDVAIAIDDRELAGAHVVPSALVSDAGTWWLAVHADWQSDHFASAPAEVWFFHLAADGHVIERAREQLGDYGQIDDVRVEAGHLRGRYRDDDGWRGFELVPDECTPPPAGPCDARRWERGTGPTPSATRWSVPLDYDTHAATLVAHGERGAELWRAPLGESLIVIEPVDGGETVHVLTIASRTRERETPPTLVHSIDAATGAIVRETRLAAREARSGCIGIDGDRVLAGVGSSPFELFDGAESIATFEGEWHGCAIATLPDHLVVTANRVRYETSAGPETEIVVHVLSRDGRTLEATHVLPGIARTDDLLVDDAGAWLTSTDLGWGYSLTRLGLDGTPAAPPRLLETLYFYPDTRLVVTELGPSLLWANDVEEGVVPLCHGADAAP